MLLTDFAITTGLCVVAGFVTIALTCKRRVVINSCYGGFGLSSAAYERLAEYGVPIQQHYEATRGPEVASGKYAKLKIVEIPIFTEYTIEEYDGMEHIAEKHKTWG